MLLSIEQIETLTGYLRPSAQCRALERMGIKYWTRPDGRPAVHESALTGGEPVPDVTRPRFDLINAPKASRK